MEVRHLLTFQGSPVGDMAGEWTTPDCDRLNQEIENRRGQAVREALALLVALMACAEHWKHDRAIVQVTSDSKAVLGIPVKTEVEDPSAQSNRKEREFAWDRAVARSEPILQFAHVRGKNNEWADALSRLCEPASGAKKPGLVRVAMRPSVKCC